VLEGQWGLFMRSAGILSEKDLRGGHAKIRLLKSGGCLWVPFSGAGHKGELKGDGRDRSVGKIKKVASCTPSNEKYEWGCSRLLGEKAGGRVKLRHRRRSFSNQAYN